MSSAKEIIIIYCILLKYSALFAQQPDTVKHFQAGKGETIPTQQSFMKSAVTNGANFTWKPVLSAMEATGQYRLSYGDHGAAWRQFKLEHKRVYKSAKEERERFAIFRDNLKQIERHNWHFHNQLVTYWMGVNKFSDWTREELHRFSPHLNINGSSAIKGQLVKGSATAESVDWRLQGYVTGVKDQAQCGSCWAFSTTGSLEGQWFRKTGKLIPLSEQQLMDCSRDYLNFGCLGGTVFMTFEYLMNGKGIEGEDTYPYRHQEDQCHFKADQVKATMYDYVGVLPHKSEAALQKAVETIGPVSVSFAVSRNFHHYSGGVFTDDTCRAINHAMLVVGYGSTGSQDYWIVKNSWGSDWGQQGYIYVARNRSNMCHIATMSFYPKV